MKPPKYTFIIPVYNAVPYLGKCINSLKAQKLTDWEAILVDDGSKDNSWELLLEYASKDSRIKPFHQSNAGAGAARNFAIEQSQGEWIIFVDSDDYISDDYLELLDSKIDGNDVVVIDTFRVTEKGKILGVENLSLYKDLCKDDLLRSQMTGKANWGGVRKCVKKKLLDEYKIRYSNFKNGEEALLSFQELYKAKSIGFIHEKPVYYYVKHRQSLSSALMEEDPWGKAVVAIKEFTQKDGSYHEYANTINAFNVSATVVSIDRLCRKYKGKLLKEKIVARLSIYQEVRDDSVPVDAKHLIWKARAFVICLNHNVTWPIIILSRFRRIMSIHY